jgi:hypothetical protein
MGDKTRNLEWRQRNVVDRDGDTITQVLAATTDTIVLTHSMVKLDSSAGAVTTLTLPNGEPGQILVLQSIDDADMDVTPATAFGWSVLALHETGDMATLFYANDTAGWIILSLTGDVADASPGYTFA